MSLYRIDVEFPLFKAELKVALKKYPTFKKDLVSVLEIIENTPEAGDRLKHVTGEVFKIRLGVKSQGIGKRGGYRLLYDVDFGRGVITPLALYHKADVADLDPPEMKRRLAVLGLYIQENFSPGKNPLPPI